jgi:hypothetical protein
MVLLLAAAYLLIGLMFGKFSDWATTSAMHLIWRRLAWLVSGVGFAAHIVYGHFRLGNAPGRTAMHASIAAALGAGALALAANLHEWMGASRYRPSMAIALVAWPLLTAVPAFFVAMAAAYVLNRWCRRS